MTQKTLEVPVDNIESAQSAAPHVDQLEVCNDLSSEGWTPNPELLKNIISIAAENTTKVISLIRPRIPNAAEGLEAENFMASREIMDASIASIECAGEAGADGVAIGILNSDGTIDHISCGKLIEVAQRHELEVSFLRAFDLTPDRAAAIRILTNIGVDRLLTTGIRGWDIEGVSVDRRIETLKRDVHTAEQAATSQKREPLQIMLGGGVRSSNVLKFASVSLYLHSSCRGHNEFEINELLKIKSLLDQMS